MTSARTLVTYTGCLKQSWFSWKSALASIISNINSEKLISTFAHFHENVFSTSTFLILFGSKREFPDWNRSEKLFISNTMNNKSEVCCFIRDLEKRAGMKEEMNVWTPRRKSVIMRNWCHFVEEKHDYEEKRKWGKARWWGNKEMEKSTMMRK